MRSIEPHLLESVETVLFLCYGNICRSPFCEHYWRNLGCSIRVDSAGFITTEGRPTPPEYQRIASEFGVDLSGHGSRWASRDLMNWGDLIVIMDEHNLKELEALYPESLERTVMLGSYAQPPVDEIADPFFLEANPARAVYAQMAKAVERLQDRLVHS